MAHEFEKVLVACDGYRKGERTHSSGVEVARRLGAKLEMAYMINVGRLADYVPICVGLVVPAVNRNKQLEAELVAEGREEIQSFAALCEKESGAAILRHCLSGRRGGESPGIFALHVMLPIVIPIAVEIQGTQLQHCFGTIDLPAHARAFHSVLDQVSTGRLHGP